MKKYFIPFNKGGGTIVDWDFTNPIHCLTWHQVDNGYVSSSIRINTNIKKISMHRFLLNFPNEDVDHINGIRTDNRISNIRSVSRRQNLQNMYHHRRGNLQGASFDKNPNRKKSWLAKCHLNGKSKFIGYYNTEIEAHLAYKMYTRYL